MGLVDCFKKFRIVVEDCFSINFEQHITVMNFSKTKSADHFLSHWPFLPKHQISPTCIVCCLIGLGFFEEQAIESAHHDFNENWKNFKFSKKN